MPFSMPILFVLSQDGLLCGFYAVNQRPNAPQVTKTDLKGSMENLRAGKIDIPKGVIKSVVKPVANAPPAFGTSFVSSTPLKPTPQEMKVIVLCWALVGLEPCKGKILSSLILHCCGKMSYFRVASRKRAPGN